VPVSTENKAANTAQTVKGKVKEAAGDVTGDPALRAEGKGDQAAGKVKNAGENVKEAVGSVLDDDSTGRR
jgi:uncharacterized protein YjbJ (UPF0337 family)